MYISSVSITLLFLVILCFNVESLSELYELYGVD